MIGNVVIRAPKYGVEKTFDHPRDAYQFVLACKEKKIEVEVENNSGVALTAYDARIPRDAQELIEKLEQHFGGNTVPKWHWMIKSKSHGLTTGRAWHNKRTLETIRCTITSDNLNPDDYLGVVAHEFVHAALPKIEHHGRQFYRTLFEILATYVESGITEYVKRQWRYIKSSRYWYAEMYNVESILSQYRRPELSYAAERLSPEQKAKSAVNALFGEEN